MTRIARARHPEQKTKCLRCSARIPEDRITYSTRLVLYCSKRCSERAAATRPSNAARERTRRKVFREEKTGRCCRYCGDYDTDGVLFQRKDMCSACDRALYRGGLCPKCKIPRRLIHRRGHCFTCQKPPVGWFSIVLIEASTERERLVWRYNDPHRHPTLYTASIGGKVYAFDKGELAVLILPTDRWAKIRR